jgi:hypothetical protein
MVQPPFPTYAEERLDRIAFPLGGLGAGCVCLSGTGGLTALSIRHRAEVFNEPPLVATIRVDGGEPRVLEGPVPRWKTGHPWGGGFKGSGHGGEDRTWGLPRFRSATFTARFPFATVELEQPGLPLRCRLVGWSPFLPGDADASSLPAAAFEYEFENRSDREVAAEFAFHGRNPFGGHPEGTTIAEAKAFLLRHAPADEPRLTTELRIASDDATSIDCAWPHGGWTISRTVPWRWVRDAPRGQRDHGDGTSPGGSLFAGFRLAPGAKRTITVRLSWWTPRSTLREGDRGEATHVPWYAARWGDHAALADDWAARAADLRAASARFADALHASTIPAAALEAVAANLAILKSPTVLRQHDGRMWAWEGVSDEGGSCHGTCTHVWNYAQAVPHLFPALERGLRETEFGENQDERGHQNFRAWLPIRPTDHGYHAAADGQFGGIVKAWREWRISGDTGWIRRLWPRIRASLEYGISTWDPRREGACAEPHHNTYDIEFHGEDSLTQTFYLAALTAAARIAEGLGEDGSAYVALAAKARTRLETLFTGEWYGQRIPDPATWTAAPGSPEDALKAHAEIAEVVRREGPISQYGGGVLADGVVGAWLALACGLDIDVDPARMRSHLLSVHRHNLLRDVADHPNDERSSYAVAGEGGLLVCSYPRGGRPAIPMPYVDEVFTGIEYQVAGHLILLGEREAGLELVRTARARYDGSRRNPFAEQECGHWYARALSSYGLLQALSGAVYDKRTRTMRLAPSLGGDFACFLAVDGGYGLVGVRGGKPFVDVASGAIPVERWDYVPAA